MSTAFIPVTEEIKIDYFNSQASTGHTVLSLYYDFMLTSILKQRIRLRILLKTDHQVVGQRFECRQLPSSVLVSFS